jgi:hypothetical protein
MKLVHFFNTSTGREWDLERFQMGRQWYFDVETALTFWLPILKDIRNRFMMVVMEVEPGDVYETHIHINNWTVQPHLEHARAENKLVVGGHWDSVGSKQYLVVNNGVMPHTAVEVALGELETVMRDLLE